MVDQAQFFKDLRNSNMRERITRMQAVIRLHKINSFENETDKLKDIVHFARHLFEKKLDSEHKKFVVQLSCRLYGRQGCQILDCTQNVPICY